MNHHPIFTCVLAALCLTGSTYAGTPVVQNPVDKSQFHLFNPTPVALLRELSTDRPDKTESPFTVDAGHFQIETDLVNFSYDRYNSEHSRCRSEAYAFGTTNFKVGLCNNVDFQLVVETYQKVRTSSPGSVERNSGFGDLTARLKWNLWGNDGGKTAFALMPFVKFPTNQDDLGNHAVEGGLILPLAIALPNGFDLGLMTEVDFAENSTGSDYHAEWINTVTVGHSIVGNLGGYVEFFSLVTSESRAPWVATLDLGLTYGLTANLQLDAGINIGLTRSADDLNPFVGVSWRF
jgi:Putative MetA-pathway of phenol degradation